MTAVEGKDVALYIYRDMGVGPVPVLTVCATNVTKKVTAEQINVTTVDSERENEYIGGSTDAEITLEGVRTIDDDASWQADDFEDNIGEVLRTIIIYTDANGLTLSYDMNVLITSVDDSNDVSDFSSFSVSMVRSGPWTKLKVVGDVLMDSMGNPILDSHGNYITVI